MVSEVPLVERVHFTAAALSEWSAGLLGWVRFHVKGLLIDGIALRRTRAGRVVLVFPERRDRSGRQHPIVRPINREARAQIEAAVFRELHLQALVDGELDEWKEAR